MARLSPEEAFDAWAPAAVVWSQWAKPVAFAQADEIAAPPLSEPELPPIAVPLDPASVGIVDLPGDEAVAAGLLLAERGYWPVPLFNGTSGPAPIVDVHPIMRALIHGAERLRARQPSPDAPPAFLLDARRHGGGPLDPGKYDNRWVVLPQDFPSGPFLASRGVRQAVLVQRGNTAMRDDLAHVVCRWQEHGITLRVLDLDSGTVRDRVEVTKPSGFKRAWYVAIALLGLRRSNVGGFGAQVPEQTSGGHG